MKISLLMMKKMEELTLNLLLLCYYGYEGYFINDKIYFAISLLGGNDCYGAY